MSKKNRYIAVFLIKEKRSYSIQRKRKINILTNRVSYSGKTYIVDTSEYTFREGLGFFYLIDLNKAQLQIKDKKVKEINVKPETLDDFHYNPRIIDEVLENGLVEQLTANLNNRIGKKIWDILTGLVMGGLVGFIAGFMIGAG
jgi:tyrosine-protein phosphatase YwqE